MKSLYVKGWGFAVGTALMALLVIGSNQTASAQKTATDTVPPKKEKKIRDLDEALQEIDKAQGEVEKSLKDIDWKKIETDLQESMKKMDVDLAKMKADLEKSMKDFDANKMKAEMNDAIAKIDWQGIEKELNKVKEFDMSKMKADLEKMKPELEKSMKEAQESIEKAKVELKEYKGFIDGLEKDGLIEKNGNYTIEHKNNQLIINGKVQPDEVYNRYRSFLQKHGSFNIKKSPDNFNIDKD